MGRIHGSYMSGEGYKARGVIWSEARVGEWNRGMFYRNIYIAVGGIYING